MKEKTKELLSVVEKAQENIKNVEKMPYRHKFHIMPPVGWLNDPNGLCFFDGWYHIFFQYAPETPLGGRKFWGHYRSKDMCNWEYLGVPLCPDIPQDRDGVYSGSAFVLDGKLELFYTGNVKEEGDYDYIKSGRGANVIYVSSEDGIHFSEKKILLENKDYPKECSNHVRDPKVWKEQDTYYMVLGARTLEDKGIILLYSSKNKMDWVYEKTITTKESFGYMWECPDYQSLGGKAFVMCSPQGLEPQEFCYQNIYQSGYFALDEEIVNADKEKGHETKNQLLEPPFIEWDMGFDFYAPQTFWDNQKNCILIGWAGVPDAPYTNQNAIKEGWQHSLTSPRVLQERDGRIYQLIHPSIEQLHVKEQEITTSHTKVNTQAFDLEICFQDIQMQNKSPLGVSFGEDFVFSFKEEELTLEFLNDTGEGRTLRKAKIKQLKKLRMLYDVSLVEIFVNDGEMVFTTRYYPSQHTHTQIHILGIFETANLWEIGKENEIKE